MSSPPDLATTVRELKTAMAVERASLVEFIDFEKRLTAAERCLEARIHSAERLNQLRDQLAQEALRGSHETDVFIERLLRLQSYLASKWACYEILTVTFHDLVIRRPVDAGKYKRLTLGGLLEEKSCPISISVPVKDCRWAVGFSYEVRNTVMHAGGFVDGAEPLFEGLSPGSPFSLHPRAIDGLKKRDSLAQLSPPTGNAELSVAQSDVVKYLRECESKIDKVLIYLLGLSHAAVTSIGAARSWF